MKLSLSTNWCNRRLETGEAIVEEAQRFGFDELELGFHTTPQQVEGFRRRLGEMPIGSVHAFCPVPISAPQGYPELYALASFDAEARAMARFQVVKNVRFAAEMGAETVVLHAGRVLCATPFGWGRARKRAKRGARLLEIFRGELETILPELEKNGVTLALENLPYYEGFPNEEETAQLLAADWHGRVKAWYDTGHALVRATHGWLARTPDFTPEECARYAGLHLNDGAGMSDDHLAPGDGKVDFAALAPLAAAVRHVVFEPNAGVSAEALARGVSYIRRTFGV